jgi:phytoene desaturase (3,4-didehydrolycopene-forming)
MWRWLTAPQRFDQGPSLLLLPELFHETFADFGTTLEQEGVKLVKCDPNYEVYFDDGEQFTMSSDLTVMKEQIERFEGQDGFERYLGFLQEAHRHYEVSAEHVLHKNFGSLPTLLRPSFLRYIITLHPFENIVSPGTIERDDGCRSDAPPVLPCHKIL